jgi:hypothetical protein
MVLKNKTTKFIEIMYLKTTITSKNHVIEYHISDDTFCDDTLCDKQMLCAVTLYDDTISNVNIM